MMPAGLHSRVAAGLHGLVTAGLHLRSAGMLWQLLRGIRTAGGVLVSAGVHGRGLERTVAEAMVVWHAGEAKGPDMLGRSKGCAHKCSGYWCWRGCPERDSNVRTRKRWLSDVSREAKGPGMVGRSKGG